MIRMRKLHLFQTQRLLGGFGQDDEIGLTAQHLQFAARAEQQQGIAEAQVHVAQIGPVGLGPCATGPGRSARIFRGN